MISTTQEAFPSSFTKLRYKCTLCGGTSEQAYHSQVTTLTVQRNAHTTQAQHTAKVKASPSP
jgi:hypothetical protein